MSTPADTERAEDTTDCSIFPLSPGERQICGAIGVPERSYVNALAMMPIEDLRWLLISAAIGVVLAPAVHLSITAAATYVMLTAAQVHVTTTTVLLIATVVNPLFRLTLGRTPWPMMRATNAGLLMRWCVRHPYVNEEHYWPPGAFWAGWVSGWGYFASWLVAFSSVLTKFLTEH